MDMKKTILYILIGLLMPLAAVAQSSMTDDQVMRFVLKEHEAGTSQQQIVTKLMQRGVDIQQIRRVKKIAERQYQIARVTVYGPTVYSFTVAEDGTVTSDELGSGSVSYRSDLKLTTIRFEKTNFLCELSR